MPSSCAQTAALKPRPVYNGCGRRTPCCADRPWEQPVQDDQTLLAPPPFDALYPHLLCAQMDAALGETDRYAGEQAQYNALYAELAVWLRQNYPPRSRAQWRW